MEIARARCARRAIALRILRVRRPPRRRRSRRERARRRRHRCLRRVRRLRGFLLRRRRSLRVRDLLPRRSRARRVVRRCRCLRPFPPNCRCLRLHLLESLRRAACRCLRRRRRHHRSHRAARARRHPQESRRCLRRRWPRVRPPQEAHHRRRPVERARPCRLRLPDESRHRRRQAKRADSREEEPRIHSGLFSFVGSPSSLETRAGRVRFAAAQLDSGSHESLTNERSVRLGSDRVQTKLNWRWAQLDDSPQESVPEPSSVAVTPCKSARLRAPCPTGSPA